MRKALKIISNGISAALVLLIFVYQQMISPYTPASCGYSPTCSNYMKGALRKHGPLKGLWLGIKRILRCHPFHEGGYDPVP